MSIRRVERGSEGDECEAEMAALRAVPGEVSMPAAAAHDLLAILTHALGAVGALNLKAVPWRQRKPVEVALDRLAYAQNTMRDVCRVTSESRSDR